MRTLKCVRQNNALIGGMVRALCPYWLPNSLTSKDFSKLLTPRSATSKSSATSQRAIKFFGSERHVENDSTFFFH